MHRSRILWPGIILVLLAAAFALLRLGRQNRPVAPIAKSVVPRAATGIPDRSVTSPLNQPGGGPEPDEAYTIYSALYQEPLGEPLVFAEDSITDIPQLNGSCLQPSTQEERELTAAFEAANRQSHRWEQKFAIPQQYRLLTRGEASRAQTCLDVHFQNPACDSYRQVRHVRFLGAPGLDSKHKHALVSVVRMCGSFCGSGGIFEVEKSGAVWHRAPETDFTRSCSWTYWK